jgi:hypothetical protein
MDHDHGYETTLYARSSVLANHAALSVDAFHLLPVLAFVSEMQFKGAVFEMRWLLASYIIEVKWGYFVILTSVFSCSESIAYCRKKAE